MPISLVSHLFNPVSKDLARDGGRETLLSLAGLGQHSHYWYTIDTEINRCVSIQSSCCIYTANWGSLKTIIIESSRSIISHLTFIQLSKVLRYIDIDLYKLILCE